MPKFTLRDLFALVTIVALALGWGVDHWRLYGRIYTLERSNYHLRDSLGAAWEKLGVPESERKRLWGK
jgi:hypothetical protein